MLNVGRTLDKSWQEGVTDKNLFEGYFEVPSWTAGSKERGFYTGHKSISYQETDRPIFNLFEYDTFILPQGYDLSVELIDVKSDSSYALTFKVSDIFAIGRYIRTDILTAPTSSTFTLDSAIYSAIDGYDARFLINNALLEEKGIFLCRITNPSDNTKVLRSFSVSDNTFTLKDIGTGETSGVTGLAKNWTFELLGHYTMVKESTELPNTVTSGVIIKNVALGTGEATFKFAFSKDAPVAASSPKLAVVYYSVQNARPQYFDPVSMLQHGTYLKTEKPDFIMESSQLAGLQANSIKYYQSQKKITLLTANPFILEEDDLIYFDVSRIPAGSYRCSSAKITTKHEAGELEGTTFDEMEYEFTNYDYDLDTVLATLKRKNDVAKAKVTQYLTRSYTVNLDIPVLYNRSNSTVIIADVPEPINLSTVDITTDGYKAMWEIPSGADYDSITIQRSTLADDFTEVEERELSGSATYYIFSNLASGVDKWRLYATKGSDNSGFTDPETVTLASSGLGTDSYTKQYITYRENTGTTSEDQTSNNNDLTINGSSGFWQTESIALNGTNNYTSTENTTSLKITTDLTIREVIALDSSDLNSFNLLTQNGGGNFNDSFRLDYRGDFNNKCIALFLADTGYNSSTGDNYLFIMANIILESNTKYYIQASWDNTTKTPEIIVNGISLTCYLNTSLTGGFNNYANLNSIKEPTNGLFRGVYLNTLNNFNNFRKITYYYSAIDSRVRTELEAQTDCTNIGL